VYNVYLKAGWLKNYKARMLLPPRTCGWNAMKSVINGVTIFPKASQRESLAQVREKSTLEFVSGRIEFIKDVKGPSFDRQ